MSVDVYDSNNVLVNRTYTTSSLNIDMITQNLTDGVYYYNATAYDTLNLKSTLPTRNITLEYQQVIVNICRDLNVPNTNYLINQDLSSTGSCINITVPGANVNCQGHSITGNAAVWVQKTGATLSNCRIYGFDSSSYALKVIGKSPASVTIKDSVFNNGLYGIYVAPEAGISANNISVNNNVYGIYFNNSNSGNLVTSSTFSGNTRDTLTLLGTYDNVFNNIIMTSATDTNADGVFVFDDSSNNYFSFDTFTTGASRLIAMYNYSINNTFHSSNYDSSKEIIDGTSQLIRTWDFTALVQDKAKNKLQGASVTYVASLPTNQVVFYYNPIITVTTIQCYQEFANQSSLLDNCPGLNYTGNYSGSTTPEAYDGDWNTMMLAPNANTRHLYVNYIKPNGATNESSWQIKRGGIGGIGIFAATTSNITIPADCWNYDANLLSFRVENYGGFPGFPSTVNSTCLTNNGWLEIDYDQSNIPIQRAFYEEAMIWNITNTTIVTNANITNITYGTLNGGTSTNSPGYAQLTMVQYMNIFGITYNSTPYDFTASYLNFKPATAVVPITSDTSYTFTLSDEIASTSLTRVAMWLMLGILFMIGMAASVGFFMVRMREGYSVVDIWKYFMILVIWLTIFSILYWVLAWFIMGTYYPQIPTV